jgi:predicted RecA/RadA family phage recombinase
VTTTYQQAGDVFQYANSSGSTIASNTVVKMGNILGVAQADIANGSTGPVKVTGVFEVPKVSAAVIAQGESLTWDVSAGAFDDNAATPATGDVTGAPAVAFEAAGNGVTTMMVRFTGVPGTVT